ncbi:hypothetical protein [Saliniramus sp.]|uniref:hypothetical protein n=1 Tax=Saliniramus sp. TaxID=2986772 RepID=UPI002C47042B|nr:hypothetical protein [Saliniramus sp.]HMB09033.1 hypothetical protein [Saliniramus sp.]
MFIKTRRLAHFLWQATIGRSGFLFHGNDELFKSLAKDANVYGEYGVGKSTVWIVNNTSAKVIAVDTSEKWINKVTKRTKRRKNIYIHHSDLGDIGFMGRPKNYSRRNFFPDYTNYLWDQEEKPDLILIDGRFRVCCFLTSLKFAEEGAKIIFDDYVNRPHYHVVERYVARTEECGRQALFVVPPKECIDLQELDKDINDFRNVMD